MAEPTYMFRQGDLPKLDLQVDREQTSQHGERSGSLIVVYRV